MDLFSSPSNLTQEYGWEDYPQNLDLPPLDVDTSIGHTRLSELEPRLFVDKEFSVIKFLAFDPEHTGNARHVDSIRTGEDMGEVFSRNYSSIVLVTLGVVFKFLDVVRIFSEKIGPVEESFNAFFVNIAPSVPLDKTRVPRDSALVGNDSTRADDCSFEIGYNVKYVAPHGRTYPNDPFSIREVGVYQKYSFKDQKCQWIFLQAPDTLKDRIRRTLECSVDGRKPASQVQVHALLLCSVSEEWRDYLVYLEENFNKVVDRGFYTNIKGPQSQGDIQTDFSDIRRMQILTDKLRRLSQIIGLNLELGEQMKTSLRKIQSNSPSGDHTIFDRSEIRFDQFIFQLRTTSSRISALIARAEGISQLVQNILDIRSTEASKQMNIEMQKLTEQGVKENKLMKKLTQKSTQDTRSMMTIALISAIFLPATFLATLFGSNFFGYSQQDNKLTVASNIWVYVVTAVGLSSITILCWFSWRRRRVQGHQRWEREDELESMMEMSTA